MAIWTVVVSIIFVSFASQITLVSVDACSASDPCKNPKACCSQWGSCGFGPDFCGKGCLADCDAEPACSASKKCSPNACCSKYGSCGFGEDFCGSGCQSGCEAKKPEGECSARNPCKVNACCSEYGNCGYGPKFCGKGCLATCDAKPECGEFALEQKCPLSVCCSKWGHCGTTSDFCGAGCQGGCKSPSKPSCSAPPSQYYIGYYASWSASRKCSAYKPTDIDAKNFTHLNYAFGTIRGGVMVAPSGDELLHIRQFTNLKKVNNQLKVLVSVGGWTFSDPGETREEFHNIVSTGTNRRKFIDSVASYLETHKFDGIDIDYEYPTAEDRGGRKEDTDNYLQLVKEMRGAFGSKFLITIAAPASYWYLRHFKIGKMSEYLDWINLMTYDFHGTWDAGIASLGPYVNSHTDIRMVKDALDLCFRDGVPSNKIALGLGFYGRSFTLKDPSCTNAGCGFSGPAQPGKCTDAAGILALFEINEIMKEKKLKARLDSKSMSKILSWGDQWVAFDDEETLSYRRDFAANNCLRGVMIWSIDQAEKPKIVDTESPDAGQGSIGSKGDSQKSVLKKNTPCIFSSDWGAYKDHGCVDCGTRQFSSRLWNIKGDWEAVCMRTAGLPPGYTCTKPSYCKNLGFLDGERGYFKVDDNSCDNPNWGKYRNDGCLKDKCGVRKYSARLWNIQGSWEDACAKTHGSPPGVKCQKPIRCHKEGVLSAGGIYGEWEVSDKSCNADHWGNFDKGGCSRPAYREYSAILYGIPKGQSWEGCCEGFGATINGQRFGKPKKCEKTRLNLNIKGYFDVVDAECLPHWSECSGKNRRKRSSKSTCLTFLDNAAFLFAALGALRLQQPPARNPCPNPVVNYQRGYRDRLEYLYAEIRPCHLDTGTDTNQEIRDYAHSMGRSNDDAGHIVASRLGGSGRDTYNIFPQSPNFNRGVWRQQEAIVYDDVGRSATSNLNPYARCTYRFIYDSDSATRPAAMLYEFILPSGLVIRNDIVNP